MVWLQSNRNYKQDRFSMNMLKIIMPPVHKEGYYFIFVFAFITILLFIASNKLGMLGTILTLWCIFFFRDPERVVPIGDNFVVSPADGVVQRIMVTSAPPELELGNQQFNRVSIFLNVFNVHVNRNPTTGKITKLFYHPGKFLNASLDKASIDNERQAVMMETKDGKTIIYTQIAGLVARRIVCNLEENQTVQAGSRFGIIRFGSRMDVYMPLDVHPMVVEGQQVIGGETVLADMDGGYSAREGEVR